MWALSASRKVGALPAECAYPPVALVAPAAPPRPPVPKLGPAPECVSLFDPLPEFDGSLSTAGVDDTAVTV